MKKLFLLLLALALASCAPKHQREVTPEMVNAMTVYADQYEELYPSEEINTARVCSQSQTGVYYKASISSYAVTCVTSLGGYGVVIMDEYSVNNTFGLAAQSQGDLENILNGLGFK
jgi:hypothetical protein